jgi:opacity protein-like surface antigen
MKKTLLLIITFLLVSQLNAQVRDSSAVSDVIIQVDGTVFYGKVIEVNETQIKYRNTSVQDGPIVVLPREQIYMISYSNNTSQLITPEFGKKQTVEKAVDKDSVKTTSANVNPDNKFRYNIGHGTIKLGFGFSPMYTSVKGIEGYNKVQTFPSMEASYQFTLKKYLILGANIGYAGYNYAYSESSDYDQIDISQEINETFINYGMFARYDIMHEFFRPYVLAGLDVNYSIVDTHGEVFFKEEGKNIMVNSSGKGFKTYFVFRGGFDFHITKSFGLYADVGSGASLVRVGVMFMLH